MRNINQSGPLYEEYRLTNQCSEIFHTDVELQSSRQRSLSFVFDTV